MKNLFICTALMASFFISSAQPNNPYNQKGVNYIASLDIIQTDYNSGKVKDFNEETLKSYSKSLPLETQVSVDVASAVIRKKNSGNLDFNNFISATSLSDISKQALKDIVQNPNSLTDAAYKSSLTAKTDAINASSISANEKELVLSLIAISYNIPDNISKSSATLIGSRSRGCWISGPNGEGPGTNAQCIAAGAIVGGIIGWEICGFWCALGGAVVGGVVGALS